MSPAAVLRHSRCIARKRRAGLNTEWHWEHLAREFGVGPLATVDGTGEPPLWPWWVLAAVLIAAGVGVAMS